MIRRLRSMAYQERLKELGLLSLQWRKLKGDMITVMKYIEAFPKKKQIVNLPGAWWIGRGAKEIYVRYWEGLSHCKLNKTVTFIAWIACSLHYGFLKSRQTHIRNGSIIDPELGQEDYDY